MKKIIELFLTFAKIGAVTFGGGYAMLPILQREVVEKHKWATEEELLDYYAVGQCTPGVIAVNTATFIGYKEKGIIGGIFATLGVICPSIIILTILAAFIDNFSEYAIVQHAMAGIRVCVCALVISAVVKLLKKAVRNTLGLVIFGACFLLAVFCPDIQTALLVVLAGVVGFVFGSLKEKKAERKK